MFQNFLFLFLSFCILTPPTPATPLSFKIDFNDPNISNNITTKSDAFINKGIQLTKDGYYDNIKNSVGRAFYKEPMFLWDRQTRELTNFTTHFSFQIVTKSGSGADGLAFFLSPDLSDAPNNSAGGSLGLFSSTNTSANSLLLAVEFDTYENFGIDPNYTYPHSHIGIDINSTKSLKTAEWIGRFNTGDPLNATVSYSGDTMNLSVFLTNHTMNLSISYVVDLRNILPENVYVGFSAATGTDIQTHSILAWDFNSTLVSKASTPTPPVSKKKRSKIGLLVGLSVGAVVLVIAFGLLWSVLRMKRPTETTGNEEEVEMDLAMDDEFERDKGPKKFLYSDLAKATNNFSDEEKLGEGGFGNVYKGLLQEEKQVAIKRISRGSSQGKKEYISEVKIINKVRHRNLVQLEGWCHNRGDFLLVYEFMPNSSLDKHIYGKERLLSWSQRYKIAVDLASALLYLHEGWEQCVVHRDIKPSNVMLDSAFNAKLGDFGLARLIDHDSDLQTTIVAGTRGYMAPEYINTGKASKESDVYSFGIVALEISCGRRPVDLREEPGKVLLVEFVWDLYGKGMILDGADKRLENEFDEHQIERLMIVGLWCAHPDYKLRPSMRQAISVLNFEASLPILPSKMPVPMYFAPPLDLAHSAYASTSSSGGFHGTSHTHSSYASYSSQSTEPASTSQSTHLLSSR
ncbi:L-type lectin-domain containing receptor kinase IX.1-like [Dioscorea cayenensis subsp. rotundata]|uniref:non-specific serine/threonine protein kinase n=1 Tax=Dioscorea cayennensis subsp. rotundata TaxID=55577 RepID=A0AB40CHJ4_DIOCR|nr:L-type lectin-domain containing receptor kinase IX.1-like [Dioscorea cayenensis subsp. rotundata]